MTVKELYDLLTPLINTNKENIPVLFHVEAKTFDSHMVNISRVFTEESPIEHLFLDTKEGYHKQEKLLEICKQILKNNHYNKSGYWYKALKEATGLSEEELK